MENTKIQKIQNPTTKNIYKEIIQNGSKQHQVAGEKLWKKLIPNLDFQKKLEKYVYILCRTILHRSTF